MLNELVASLVLRSSFLITQKDRVKEGGRVGRSAIFNSWPPSGMAVFRSKTYLEEVVARVCDLGFAEVVPRKS
jgi:hypothetical protein